jgi:hypothetical protein
MQYSAVFVAFMIGIGGVITAPAELAKGNNNASLAVSANEVAGTDKSYNKEQNYIIASWSQPGKAEKTKLDSIIYKTHADPERKAAPIVFIDPPPFWKNPKEPTPEPEPEEKEFWCKDTMDCEEKMKNLFENVLHEPYMGTIWSRVAKNKRQNSREFCTFSPLP